jgi:hypothetical protein
LLVYYENSTPPPREHPWQGAESGNDAAYHNFVERPDLISTVLENFKPHADWGAIQTFYELLRWLNGPISPFETNDCGLMDPCVDPNAPDLIRPRFETDPLKIYGRLAVLYRDLGRNTSPQHVSWLKKCIFDGLGQRVEDFPAAVSISDWPHWFIALDKPGHVVLLQYWSWGSDTAQAVHNLDGIYQSLLGLFQSIAAVLDPSLPR